jgi:hypothetical protein
MIQYVHLYSRYLTVDIEKPLFEYNNSSTIRINKSIIDRAIHNFVNIVIRTPKGERVFFPKAIKKQGKKVKEVFLYPDMPMVMYELEIPYSEKRDEDYYKFA